MSTQPKKRSFIDPEHETCPYKQQQGGHTKVLTPADDLIDLIFCMVVLIVQRILRSEMNGFAGYGIAANGLILCKVSQKVEKAVRSYGQGQHFSAKMRATE
ncbi:hypothetical protein RB195_023697 [Necator americanus]|uniref:Uncharacterized protein n=1 Tax=Necator americanus TaxID=51031 RepID=A0ABR1EK79_NECAM